MKSILQHMDMTFITLSKAAAAHLTLRTRPDHVSAAAAHLVLIAQHPLLAGPVAQGRHAPPDGGQQGCVEVGEAPLGHSQELVQPWGGDRHPCTESAHMSQATFCP